MPYEFVSKEDFVAYLRTLPSDQRFGGARWNEECPLACCLRQKGLPRPQVGNCGWGVEGFARSDALPDWAQNFVQRFDTVYPFQQTAAKALEIMETLIHDAIGSD